MKTKMKTGGMVNPNAKLQAAKSAGFAINIFG